MKNSLKWLIALIAAVALVLYLFSTSGMGKIATDITQAYAEKELYNKAIARANSDQRVLEKIGKIEPINKMTILNGEVNFSDDNQTLHSTIKILGAKGNGKLDLIAERASNGWHYEKINIRVMNSGKTSETIQLIHHE